MPYPAFSAGRRLVLACALGLVALPRAGIPAPLETGTFSGTLPSVDRAGAEWQLELFADGAFYLSTRKPGGSGAGPHFDIGSWSLQANGRVLVLFGGGEAPIRLAVGDTNTLRLLDPEGHPFADGEARDLRRTTDASPLEPRLPLRGMYRYLADAALFVECLTGRRFPVAMEAGNAALESAYLEIRREPGEEILVSLEGTIASRPRMEGEGRQPTLVVERLIGIWPGESCGARMDTAPLQDMLWKLTRLGSSPVPPREGRREPHIVLHAAEMRLSGLGSCNPLAGPYLLEGNRLRLGPLASTKMLCPDGMEMETQLLSALERTRTWKILGSHLELFDESGKLLARFEARALD